MRTATTPIPMLVWIVTAATVTQAVEGWVYFRRCFYAILSILSGGEFEHSALRSLLRLPLTSLSYYTTTINQKSSERVAVRASGLGLHEHASDRTFETWYQESRMSVKGSAQEQDSAKDEIHQLRSELQLMMEDRQAPLIHAMKEMMAEFMRNNGRSESSSVEGSAAVRWRPRGDEPTVARETSTAVAAGGGARGDTTAGRGKTLPEDASRNFGVRGRRRAAVPADVGPARGWPDQSVGEWDTYPGCELGGGYNLPLSRNLAFKHTALPSFSRRKREVLVRQETLGTTPKEQFSFCLCVGCTSIHSRWVIGYREPGTCRQGVES